MAEGMKSNQRLLRDMTLNPGDIICCGTLAGLSSMPIDCNVEVDLSRIERFKNFYTNPK